MSHIVHTRHQPPAWADWTRTRIEALLSVCRLLLPVVAYLGAAALIIWFVVGVITGFVSLAALFGVGGLGGLAETIRRVFDKDDN